MRILRHVARGGLAEGGQEIVVFLLPGRGLVGFAQPVGGLDEGAAGRADSSRDWCIPSMHRRRCRRRGSRREPGRRPAASRSPGCAGAAPGCAPAIRSSFGQTDSSQALSWVSCAWRTQVHSTMPFSFEKSCHHLDAAVGLAGRSARRPRRCGPPCPAPSIAAASSRNAPSTIHSPR